MRYLRPTLYDLLAHRALDYFKSDERDITRPAYAFEIKEKEAFAPANEFVKHKFIYQRFRITSPQSIINFSKPFVIS